MSQDEPDGLDLQRLRALRRPRHDLDHLQNRIAQHLDDHDGYLAFSGGKDSLAALHLTLQVEPNIPVVFFDSGLEYPETYRYITELADTWNLNLDLRPAQPPLLSILAASGEWDHTRPNQSDCRALRDILITEPAQAAHAAHGPGEVWGVRADESPKGTGRWSLYYNALTLETARTCTECCATAAQRRANHGGQFSRTDGTHVFGPVWDWSIDDIWSHIARHELPVNPVYDKLRQLGTPPTQLRVSHMIDGAFLEHGRITRLRRGWPSLFEELAQALPRIREFI
ncbi:phosphoadenosine phosphosulfate reductase family protein [Antrihabitans spumae]|uniref:Phosphoadenosine phosphosulfate reductase family protein n=1 Tax=Antrihabitans spumae TaxID=3373370 RepID=A0ABW7JUQ2_9NOCA